MYHFSFGSKAQSRIIHCMYLKHIFKCIYLEISIVAFLRIESLFPFVLFVSVEILIWFSLVFVIIKSGCTFLGRTWYQWYLLLRTAHAEVCSCTSPWQSNSCNLRKVLVLFFYDVVVIFPIANSVWEDAPGPCRRYALKHILLHSALFALASLYHGNSTVISLKL